MESPRCNGVGFRVKSAACWRSWVTFNVGLVPALEAKFRVGRTQLKSSVIFGNVIRIGICFYFSWRTRSTTGPQLCLLVEHEPRFFEKIWLESGFTWRLNGNWPWVSVHFQKNWTRTGFEFQNQNQNLFVSRTIFSLLTKGEYGRAWWIFFDDWNPKLYDTKEIWYCTYNWCSAQNNLQKV